ncbi:MAG: hypothetical protein WCD49_14730 [Candidatus Acidiferrales bacterium]
MKQNAILDLALILCFASYASTARGRDNQPQTPSQSQSQSPSDAARQARDAKSAAPQSSTVVIDNASANQGASTNPAVASRLSADRQAYCEELRKRKDTSAEQACAALTIDMGADYEALADRFTQLAKTVCAANNGLMPSTQPPDPAIAAQWRDLVAANSKFSEMMKAEMKTLSDAEAAVKSISEEELREASEKLPDWPDAKAVAHNPQEKQRFHEIQEKYKPRIHGVELIAAQEKPRVQKYFYDLERTQEICGRH